MSKKTEKVTLSTGKEITLRPLKYKESILLGDLEKNSDQALKMMELSIVEDNKKEIIDDLELIEGAELNKIIAKLNKLDDKAFLSKG